MAKPSYDEVIEQRNAAREEAEKFKQLAADFEADIVDLRKQIEELTTPVAGGLAAQLDEALERVRVLEAENAELSEKLELLRLNPIGAQLANGLPEAAPSAAIHEIPDDDPSDPRPEMHPALGWSDPAVIAWAERRSSARVATNEEA